MAAVSRMSNPERVVITAVLLRYLVDLSRLRMTYSALG